MLLLAIILKGLAEVMFVVLLGQGLLFLLAGPRRHENLVYKAFATVTSPIMKVARLVTPRFIVDAHIGFVAVFLVALLWVVALALKVHYTLEAARARPPTGVTAPPAPSTPSPPAPARPPS